MTPRLSPDEARDALTVLKRRLAHIAHAIRALEYLQKDKTLIQFLMERRRKAA